MIKILKLRPKAVIPTRGSSDAAGLDLHIISPIALLSGHRAMLPIGIAMEIPVGYVGLIWPRSKLAVKAGIVVLAGVVDSDYRGEIHVALLNTSSETVELHEGDKVAQMVIQPVALWSTLEVTSLSKTVRDTAGITDSELRL